MQGLTLTMHEANEFIPMQVCPVCLQQGQGSSLDV
jgi:hypothetical protein